MDVNTKKTYSKTRPYPVIQPYVINKDLRIGYNPLDGGKSFLVFYFFEKYQDAIKKGLRDGVPNASGNYSEGIVTDAMKYLNQRDATSDDILIDFYSWFKGTPYKKKILNDYIQFYYSGADKNTSSYFNNEKIWNEIDKSIFLDAYIDKLREIQMALTSYQGGIADAAKTYQYSSEAGLQNQDSGTGGGNNQNGNGGGSSATSNTNYLLIGIVILVGIFLLKRSKK